jgi:nitrogen regulatory protein P-II 2
MKTQARKLLVVIGEAALERLLVDEVRRLGASGYTVSDVRGEGGHGSRDANWEGDRSIELKVICDEGLAQALAGQIIERYARDYSLSLYIGDIEVFRGDKYP